MKIEVNITKSRFYALVASISLFILTVAVVAFNSNPADPSVFGHSANEVEGVCYFDGTDWVNCPPAAGGAQGSGQSFTWLDDPIVIGDIWDPGRNGPTDSEWRLIDNTETLAYANSVAIIYIEGTPRNALNTDVGIRRTGSNYELILETSDVEHTTMLLDENGQFEYQLQGNPSSARFTIIGFIQPGGEGSGSSGGPYVVACTNDQTIAEQNDDTPCGIAYRNAQHSNPATLDLTQETWVPLFCIHPTGGSYLGDSLIWFPGRNWYASTNDDWTACNPMYVMRIDQGASGGRGNEWSDPEDPGAQPPTTQREAEEIGAPLMWVVNDDVQTTEWRCGNNLDLEAYCGDDDGCYVRLLMNHKRASESDQVRTIDGWMYIEEETFSSRTTSGLYGWTRMGNADFSFITGDNVQHNAFHPWDWMFLTDSYHHWCPGGDDTIYSDPYTFTMLVHPNVRAKMIIYDSGPNGIPPVELETDEYIPDSFIYWADFGGKHEGCWFRTQKDSCSVNEGIHNREEWSWQRCQDFARTKTEEVCGNIGTWSWDTYNKATIN